MKSLLFHRSYFKRLSQLGASRITLIVFGALFGAIAFAVYNIAPFYYYYFELHNQMSAIIPRGDILKDEEIRKRLAKVIKDLDIPAEPQDMIIDRRDRHIKLSISYTEVFYIKLGKRVIDIRDFPFSVQVEGEF